jgi:hypothetical protein
MPIAIGRQDFMDIYSIAASLLDRSSQRASHAPKQVHPVTRLAAAVAIIALAAAGLTYAGEALPRVPVTLVASTAHGDIR